MDSKAAAGRYACPLCSALFSEAEINVHVNECLNNVNLEDDNDFETSLEIHSSDVSDNESKSDQIASKGSTDEARTCASPDFLPLVTASHSNRDSFSNAETKTSSWSFLKSSNISRNQERGDQIAKNPARGTRRNQNSQKTNLPTSRKHTIEPDLESKSMMSDSKRPRVQTSELILPNSEHVQKSRPSGKTSTAASSMNLPQSLASKGFGGPAVPLAEKMRPLCLDDFVGQEDVVGNDTLLRRLLESETFPSMILWGPPGCGKTTLARIVAQRCRKTNSWHFMSLSATMSGIAEIKNAVQVAKNEKSLCKRKTVLFIDEIHRFNKLQQDAFLPHIEDGTIVLIGATTENPSFHINNALLSRCKVFVLGKLTPENIRNILQKTLVHFNIGLWPEETEEVSSRLTTGGVHRTCVAPGAIDLISQMCDGDARSALNCFQNLLDSKSAAGSTDTVVITEEDAKQSLLRSHVQYDRAGEEHYNCASALQKSIRGSSDDGAIYWLARMLEGGEDPLFIARRLVVCASEDIGLADVHALPLAVSTFQACHFIGMPECALNLAHCVTYLARAPKSNEAYAALEQARDSIRKHAGPLPGVPLHLRNAPTKLMKDLGYHKGYQYNHNIKGPAHQEYLPKELLGVSFFKS